MPHLPSLNSIQTNIKLPDLTAPAAGPSTGGDAFRSLLQQSVDRVSQLQNESDVAVDKFMTGEQDDPHNMMLSVQRAGLAFDMFVQVRNKVVSAYQEVMKMAD